jgi:hypothetical protein
VNGVEMKISQRTRGISPVLTVLLLISIAVGSALITQMWVITYVNNTMIKVEHVIWIPSVSFLEEGNDIIITIYVQNIHDGTVQVTQVYINSVLVHEEDVTLPGDGFIEESETCAITVSNQAIIKNEEIHIKVVCIDGVSTEDDYKVVTN